MQRCDAGPDALNRRSGRQPDVREAAFEQHLKFNDADAHHAVTIQNAALHLEMTHPMLVHELTNPFESPL